MANTVGRFDYSLTTPKKGAYPFDPVVNICLSNRMQGEGVKSPAISPNLMSECELDVYIDSLKKELDAVRSRARRALKNALPAHG
jgi:hypothetical protein